MTDEQIEIYLNQNNWHVKPNDFIHKVLNTSPQIYDEKIFDFKNNLLTIQTPTKIFTFYWDLK